MISFSKSFKRKIGFLSISSLAVFSCLLSSPEAYGMDEPEEQDRLHSPLYHAQEPTHLDANAGLTTTLWNFVSTASLAVLSRVFPTETMPYSGDAEAQYKLARTYEKGQYVKSRCGGHDYADEWTTKWTNEPKKALQYYQLAADQGHAEAQFCLGNMLCRNSDARDKAAVLKYFTLAANQGYVRAQRMLGQRYITEARGKAPEIAHQYFELARLYLELAAAQGDEEAIVSLDGMHARMKAYPGG